MEPLGALWAALLQHAPALPEWASPRFQLATITPLLLRALDPGCGDGGAATVRLRVAGLDTALAVTASELASVHQPLLVFLALCGQSAAARCGGGGGAHRLVCGLSGAAGAGKSTLAQLLRVVGNAWHALMCDRGASGGDAACAAYVAARRAGGAAGARRRRPDDDWVAVVSMDGYHRTNAQLAAAGLSAHKGRIDTIDAAAFARDLAQLRDAPSSTDATLWFSEYDRAVTHDPVPRGVCVHPCHELVLVEGLYVGSSSGRSSDGGGDPDPWLAVRAALDVAVFLDVPLRVCRGRAVARKAAAGRMTEAAAAAHFDAVDAPVWAALQHARHRPSTGIAVALLRGLGGGGAGAAAVQPPAASAGGGPDLVLALAPPLVNAAPPAGGAPSGGRLVGATLRHAPWAPGAGLALHPPTPVEPPPPRSRSRLLVLGLNPCVQRSLVFRPPPGAQPEPGGGSGAPPPPPPAWLRGEVNRAHETHVTVGGKGQHVAIGLARAAAAAAGDAAAAPIDVVLAQFLGGATGAMAREFLRDAFASAAESCAAPLGAPAVAAAPTATGHAARTAEYDGAQARRAARLCECTTTVQLRPGSSQATRTCTTLLDAAVGDMTELIEPPAPVDASQVAQLLRGVLRELGVRAVDGDACADGGVGAASGDGVVDTADASDGGGDEEEGAGPPVSPLLAPGSAGAAATAAGGGDGTPLAAAPAAVAVAAAAAVAPARRRCPVAGAPPLAGVALMGTVPPGAEAVFEAVSAQLAAAGARGGTAAAAAPPVLVLLDAVKGAWPCLLAGGVSVLKINAAELAALVAEGRALAALHPARYGGVGAALAAGERAVARAGCSADSGDGGDGGNDAPVAALEGVCGTVSALEAAATICRQGMAVLHALSGTALAAVAVTDGPHAAHLLERLGLNLMSGWSPNLNLLERLGGTTSGLNEHQVLLGGGCGGGGGVAAAGAAATGEAAAGAAALLGCRHTTYVLPPLPGGRRVVNPIGAGDSVAAATLFHRAVGGLPLAEALACGLAAGSASVLGMRGAAWEHADAAAVLAGVRAAAEDVWVAISDDGSM